MKRFQDKLRMFKGDRTYRELGRDLGLDHSLLSRLGTGRGVKISTWVRFLCATDVNPDFWFDDSIPSSELHFYTRLKD